MITPKTSNPPANPGAALAAAWEARGLTDVEMARRAGISRQRVGKIKRGGTLMMETTLRLCEILDIDPHSIDHRLASTDPA